MTKNSKIPLLLFGGLIAWAVFKPKRTSPAYPPDAVSTGSGSGTIPLPDSNVPMDVLTNTNNSTPWNSPIVLKATEAKEGNLGGIY